MEYSVLLLALGFSILLTISLLFSLIMSARKNIQLKKQLTELADSLDALSRKRIDQSKSVILGQVAEQFAPYMPAFPYNPKDARFLGAPVDYIVFDGLNDHPQGPTEIRQVIFLEIKTAQSQLSTSEKAIKKALQNGKVGFQTLRLDL